MRRECRERFPRLRLQRKPLDGDPGMHHGTCVTHVPWCIPESLTRGGGKNVPGIPGACATDSFSYLIRGTLLVFWSTWHHTNDIKVVFQYPIRHPIVRPRDVLKSRLWSLTYRFEIWHLRISDVGHNSEESDNSKDKSRGFETLQDLIKIFLSDIRTAPTVGCHIVIII